MPFPFEKENERTICWTVGCACLWKSDVLNDVTYLPPPFQILVIKLNSLLSLFNNNVSCGRWFFFLYFLLFIPPIYCKVVDGNVVCCPLWLLNVKLNKQKENIHSTSIWFWPGFCQRRQFRDAFGKNYFAVAMYPTNIWVHISCMRWSSMLN